MRARALFISLALAFGATAITATPARADWVWRRRNHFNPYARSHFYMGVGGVGAVVLNQTGPRGFVGSGGGFSLFLGGRIARAFALEFAWQPTFHQTSRESSLFLFNQPDRLIGMEAFTLDGKIYFAYGQVQPFIVFGMGGYAIADRFSVFAGGPGYQIGGGVDFWLSPFASLGVRAQYRGIALIDYNPYNDTTYISMVTATVDFTGHF